RGSVPEVVADAETGFVLPVDGFGEAAADALRRVGDIDPKACRRRVEERFSKEAMVTGYERAYERALAT
ncbi:MAG TPA: glycosyltransferase family 4 protein, partial [Actinomycetota bacterium]|nr:glycosyltransferase family 4 protein [Actinomycetota bacterium]